MLLTRVHLLVALAIALIGFAIAQVTPGLGIWFVIPAALMWTVWSAKRQRKAGRTG